MTDPNPVAPPALLTKAHDSASFDCGEPVLDDWLRRCAWDDRQIAASGTHVVCPSASNRIAGYFALSMGQILGTEVTGSVRRNMPRQMPAVVLGRLASDRACQGQGLGRAVVFEVLRRAVVAPAEVSARLVIVHAISAAAAVFYRHHGFTRLPVEAPTLALDLIRFQKLS